MKTKKAYVIAAVVLALIILVAAYFAIGYFKNKDYYDALSQIKQEKVEIGQPALYDSSLDPLEILSHKENPDFKPQVSGKLELKLQSVIPVSASDFLKMRPEFTDGEPGSPDPNGRINFVLDYTLTNIDANLLGDGEQDSILLGVADLIPNDLSRGIVSLPLGFKFIDGDSFKVSEKGYLKLPKGQTAHLQSLYSVPQEKVEDSLKFGFTISPNADYYEISKEMLEVK